MKTRLGERAGKNASQYVIYCPLSAFPFYGFYGVGDGRKAIKVHGGLFLAHFLFPPHHITIRILAH